MKKSRRKWFVVVVFFGFILLHQADKLMIGPLTTPIMETFGIDEAEMGAVSTGALIVGAIAYPLWGYLYDRFSRTRLLALASFLWGSTTWLNALAPKFSTFLITRASTGIDDSSYPGLYSLISDYFGPDQRGKVIGLLQVGMPLGYLVGMIFALLFHETLGWRSMYYITGGAGIVLAVIIFLFVKDLPRGKSEPEMQNVELDEGFTFDWNVAKGLFRKPSLVLLFVQGFFGVFPWNAIVFWIFRYMETERGFDENQIMIAMVIAVLVLSAGYFAGGAAGDWMFKRTPRGRVLVSSVAVLLGAALFWFSISLPYQQFVPFVIALAATAVFIPISAPNIVSTVHDIALPEVRSTAVAIQYFIESGGAALSPLLVGLIARSSSLENALLIICTSTWIVCGLTLMAVAVIIPKDIRIMRQQLQERANQLSVGATDFAA